METLDMGLPIPSYEPPKSLLPLEARRVHFCPASLPVYKPPLDTTYVQHVGNWRVCDPAEADMSFHKGYEFRYDMFGQEGNPAQMLAVINIASRVRSFVTGEGWLPRCENYRGEGHCFDLIFLRRNRAERMIDAYEPPADNPEPDNAEWWPGSGARSPLRLQSPVEFQENETPESVSPGEQNLGDGWRYVEDAPSEEDHHFLSWSHIEYAEQPERLITRGYTRLETPTRAAETLEAQRERWMREMRDKMVASSFC